MPATTASASMRMTQRVLALPTPSGQPHFGCRCGAVNGARVVGAVCPAHGYAINQGEGGCLCPPGTPIHTVECQLAAWQEWEYDLAIQAQASVRCAACPTPWYELCTAACCQGAV